MKFYITGEKGLIARNLKGVLETSGHIVVSDDQLFRHLDHSGRSLRAYPKTGEACVHRNDEATWAEAFRLNAIDVVVHNAAVVGTDVVALDPAEATLSNVQGTYNIVRAANAAGVGVCYLGTTVIYDNVKYQSEPIFEHSDKAPKTFYGIQKLAAEQVVTTSAKRWCVVRPLFAFGGLGDMNSLIAKSVYAHLTSRPQVDMFLDPEKKKDYLHVTDFCRAVETVCRRPEGWGTDWNVAAETPVPVSGVMALVDEVLGAPVSDRLRWHPQTDYLGNHVLTSWKIRTKLGWKPTMDLRQGILATAEWIKGASDYNPLKYLDEAAQKNVDLLQHFPK